MRVSAGLGAGEVGGGEEDEEGVDEVLGGEDVIGAAVADLRAADVQGRGVLYLTQAQ